MAYSASDFVVLLPSSMLCVCIYLLPSLWYGQIKSRTSQFSTKYPYRSSRIADALIERVKRITPTQASRLWLSAIWYGTESVVRDLAGKPSHQIPLSEAIAWVSGTQGTAQCFENNRYRKAGNMTEVRNIPYRVQKPKLAFGISASHIFARDWIGQLLSVANHQLPSVLTPGLSLQLRTLA